MAGEFVGLICDGNRRDEMKHLHDQGGREVTNVKELSYDELIECYSRGADVVKAVTERARKESLAILALWGLSGKNMDRDDQEKAALFFIFEKYLRELRDDWMNREENEKVRLVHLGRKDRLAVQAPQVMDLLDEVEDHTRTRTGMVIALSLDHDPKEENKRAHRAWRLLNRPGDPDEGWRDFLDLHWNGVKSQPASLIIRTGAEEERRSTYLNEYLLDYQHETRFITHKLLLPMYSADQFSDDLADYRQSTKKGGK